MNAKKGEKLWQELAARKIAEERAQIEKMTREQLGAWYKAQIGYSPIEEEPSMQTEALRAACLGVFVEICRDRLAAR